MMLHRKSRLIFDSLIPSKFVIAGIFISFLTVLSGCDSTETVTTETVDETEVVDDTESTDASEVIVDADFEATDWTDATHSKSADPNFDEVFDNSQVKRLDMVISEDNWAVMLDDMTNLYGEFGSSSTDSGMGGPPSGGPGEDVTDTDALIDDSDDPIFVAGDVYYNDIQWYKVGLRFKGNSSLKSSWEQGILKLSFKLDFDEYEDDYPQIKNQRFYGFKKLSLKNNYDDQSLLREKVAADIFESAGLAVSHTAFYALYVDHGEGPTYFGLYTLVEEISDTVIDTQFDDDNGNLYKPEDDSASFNDDGTFVATDIEKKTNDDEDEADWSDIEALFSAINADQTDSVTWRENLDAVFDTDVFLKYLAINGLIQNWDTYGRMTHNFYLYNDPTTEKLTWIPWDNNEALQEGKLGGSLALDFSDLDSGEWPLIENIMADSVYKAKYDAYITEIMSDAFEVNKMQALYDYYGALVESYAESELAGYTFLNGSYSNAIDELKEHVSSRETAAENYLD